MSKKFKLKINNPTKFSGFSLIELMIVVAIISMLTVIAIPSYQSYIQRARFTEVILIAGTFKTAVTLALQQGVLLKDINSGSLGIPNIPSSTKNLASIKIKEGVITATGTELSGKANYILKPNSDGSHWEISGSCLKLGFCNA